MGLLESPAHPALAAGRATRTWRRVRLGDLLAAVAVTLGGVIMFLPVAWMVLSSFKSSAEILQAPPTFWPQHPSLQAYRTVLSDPDHPLLTYVKNSTIVTLAVTASVLFTSTLAGYVFAKFAFFGKNVLFVLVLSTLMVPFQVVMIPLYLVMRSLDLVNTLWSLILPALVSAFGIFLMKQFIEGLPTAMIEAGRIDGASEFTIYRRIIVPQVIPALTALGLFTFMGTWNDYLWPLIMINDEATKTLALGIASFNSFHGARYDLTLAASTLSVLPIVVLFVIFQRQFVRGIALSGLKG
jgi:multiple sugar transport system permease protein